MLSEASYHNMTVGRIPSVEGGIQPTILDAKGDLIVATGNDSPNRLAVGANNLVLTADSAQATGLKWAAPDPLTTKGDLFTYSTTEARLGVGANDTVLTADSTAATGLKWAAPSSGGMTLISTTNLAGLSNLTLSSIPSTYTNLVLVMRNVVTNTIEQNTFIRFNTDSTANRHLELNTTQFIDGTSLSFNETSINSKIFTKNSGAGTDLNLGIYTFPDYTNTSTWKELNGYVVQSNYNNKVQGRRQQVNGIYNQTSAISSLYIFPASGTYTSGTVLLYGVK
jgi:hypothetical protein